MTHRFLVEPDQIRGETVTFAHGQAHQIRHVLRLRDGDSVLVFDGVTACDRVVTLGGARQGRIVGEEPQAPEPRTQLVIYPALLQRDKFEPVLQKLVEVGAKSIVPVITERSLVREAPDEKRYMRWRAIIREATEQCGRGRVADLGGSQTLAEAIERAPGMKVVAYEAERRCTLRDVLVSRPSTVSVFIGPEGGFSPEEAQRAQAAGAQLVTLGPRILRTETASPIAAALVLYELGDLT